MTVTLYNSSQRTLDLLQLCDIRLRQPHQQRVAVVELIMLQVTVFANSSGIHFLTDAAP